ncbi:MAG: hypothetical protein LCH84_15745 [Gemmatimonadetes bacterium]|nr:hypothetical protein [Gemmatimonadota bacterium]
MRPLSLWLPSGAVTALFAALLLTCLVAQVLIVRGLFRAQLPGTSPALPTPRRWAEVAWAVLPIIGLLLAFVGAWRLLP